MSWKVDLVVMLRSLVGDLDSEKFTDERLRQVITVGAYNVLNDADFSNDYVVSISSLSISPNVLKLTCGLICGYLGGCFTSL